MSFEDLLCSQPGDIHFKTLENLISNHFGLDQKSSSLIVVHLLNKNHNFVCLKREQVLDAIYPERRQAREEEEKILNQYLSYAEGGAGG